MATESRPGRHDRPRVLVIGGVDVHLRLDLMDQLSATFEMIAAGSDPDLAGPFESRGFEYHWYPLSRGWSPIADVRSLRSLRRILARTQPDVAHAFATKPSVWGRIAAYKERVPVIVGTVPGLGNLYTLDDARTRAGRRVYEWLQRRACRRSDLTVFQNQDDYGRFTGSGICPPEKAEVVLGSGVRTAELDRERMPSAVREGFRAEIGAGEGEVVVTMISRITKSKGVLDFAAAAGLCGPDLRTRFVLVGPDDRHSLDRLDEGELAGVRRTVTWLGPRPDVPAILAGSDICVLPSYYREGIPRVLLEAASMALPLVAADGPGAREVVIPQRNGLLVPPKDPRALASAIGLIAADPNLRGELGAASRRMAVEKFDIGVVAAATRSQYERLLSVANRGGPAQTYGDRTNSQGAA